jgi:hypothetical protein
MDLNSLTITVDGVKKEWLIPFLVNGREFFIAKLGGIPEMENGFFYCDGKHQFCFYADIIPSDDMKYSVEVKSATQQQFRGYPVIDERDIPIICENIVYLFKNYYFSRPNIPIENKNTVQTVDFKWDLTS